MKYFFLTLLALSACSTTSIDPELEAAKEKTAQTQSLKELRSECAKILRAAQND